MVRGGGLNRIRTGYQIGRKESVERGHRLLVGGVGAKADEAIRAYEDRATVRDTRRGRVEGCCRP
jgi:hypothetical protein